MVNGLHLHSAFLVYQALRAYPLPTHATHSHTHSPMAGACKVSTSLISQEFSVLFKDSSTLACLIVNVCVPSCTAPIHGTLARFGRCELVPITQFSAQICQVTSSTFGRSNTHTKLKQLHENKTIKQGANRSSTLWSHFTSFESVNICFLYSVG